MRRGNHFPIFLSLAVKCENKLLKVYCVSKLYLQKFTSLKYHHPHRPWKAFLFLQVISFVDFTLKYKTKLQHAWFSLLKGWWGVPSLVESLFIPLHQENCPHQIFIPQTKQQFSCYNPIKTSFLAAFAAAVQFSFQFSYYLHTQVALILVFSVFNIYRMLFLALK